MSIFGAIFVLAGAASVISRDGKRSRNAFPKMNDKEYMEKFDQENSRYGIMHQMNDEKILKIAARCRVRKENGILPVDGHRECEDYVNKYLNSSRDLNDFRHAWTDCVRRQKNKKIKKNNQKHHGDNNYEYYKAELQRNNFNDYDEVVIEINHWHNLPKNEHIKRMKAIQNNTIFGEIVVEPPILRDNPRRYGGHIETWIVKWSKEDVCSDDIRICRQKCPQYFKELNTCPKKVGQCPNKTGKNNRELSLGAQKGAAKSMYYACCFKLGYDPDSKWSRKGL